MAVRTLSIRIRLLLLVVVATAVAAIISGAFSVSREISAFAEAKRVETEAIAAVFASMAADAVRDKDELAAHNVLRAMARLPAVRHVRLEASDGTTVAEHGISVRLTRDPVRSSENQRPSVLSILTSESIGLVSPVISGGEAVGRIDILIGTEELSERLKSQLLDSLVALVLAALVGVLAARSLRRGIARRIVTIAQAMRGIRETHDYGTKLANERADEIGELVTSFNAMMDEIEMRDAKLARHRENLEQTVAERTQELNVARQVADDANEAKSRFLAAMSHEIRTPMNGVLVMAEMLAKDDLAPEQRKRAEIISRSGRNLLAIIDDILDFSKIEAGKIELETIPLDLGLVLSDQTALFEARARDKGLSLKAEIDRSVAVVEGDPVRIGQIVANLVNNALKFTEKGGVTVRARRELRDPDQVLVEVVDTGVGIPADKLSSVFERFSQADVSTTRKFGGTGLGLSISLRLVEAMGGEIGVDSQLGQGSRFWFRLPLPASSQPVEMRGRPDEQMSSAADAPASWHGSKVLVVDDGEVNREIARQALGRFGIAIAEATNGIEALAAMAREEFDLVLMDGSMPELDGFEATRQQRQIDEAAGRPRRIILALTAHVVGDEANLWREAGMDGVLHKPFTLETLRNCLVRFMPAATRSRPVPTVPDVNEAADQQRRLDDLLDPLVLKSFTDLAAITGPEPVRRIFTLFREQAPGALENLRAAVLSRDADATARAAHAFKSMCLSIGTRALAKQLGEIERLARREALPTWEELAQLAVLLERSVEALHPTMPEEVRPSSAAA